MRNLTDQYLTVFLDVLGFKELLEQERYEEINALFNNIANSLCNGLTRFLISGLEDFQPKIEIFSDSIMLLYKLYPPDDKRRNFHSLLFSGVHETVAYLIAELLIQGIPIRGGINIGSLFIETASPEEIFRNRQIKGYKRYSYNEATNIIDVEWVETRDVRFFEFKTHYGPSLTNAYLLEKDKDFIGVLMNESIFANNHFYDNDLIRVKYTAPYRTNLFAFQQVLEMNRQRERYFLPISIDGEEYYAINWNRSSILSEQNLESIREKITSMVNNPTNRRDIREKWRSLKIFTDNRNRIQQSHSLYDLTSLYDFFDQNAI